MSGFIYKITNSINDKIYIGSTKNLNRRIKSHFSKKSGCIRLKHAIQKYGEDKFKFEILEEVPLSKLIKREQYYLDKLLHAQDYIKGLNRNFLTIGYNTSPTASNRFGVKELNVEHKQTKIIEYDKSGNFKKVWPSIKDIEEFYKISGISKICKTEGYPEKCNSIFRYYKEDYPLIIEVKSKRKGRTVVISKKQRKQISKSLLGKYGKPVEIIDIDKNKTFNFNTKIEAILFLNICYNTFTKAIKTGEYKNYKIKIL
jgi:group I intron endonuclease